MTDINMANRRCCDLDIRAYSTNKPWMFADFCNTTTAGFTSDNVYAMKKGGKAIAFNNPIEGTMTLEFQVHPFKIYSMFSDGVVDNKAILPVRKEVECTTAGVLEIPDVTAEKGTVFVYPLGSYGDKDIVGETVITNTEETKSTKFTATTTTEIEVGKTYIVGYLVLKTQNIKSVSFNDERIPNDYRITMETVDKNENGEFIPIKITAYKATVQRTMDLSFSSTGDPASVTMTFDVLKDKDNNVLDMVEDTSVDDEG